MSDPLLIAFLAGMIAGAAVILCLLLWRGVRQLDQERQRAIERRERMRS